MKSFIYSAAFIVCALLAAAYAPSNGFVGLMLTMLGVSLVIHVRGNLRHFMSYSVPYQPKRIKGYYSRRYPHVVY